MLVNLGTSTPHARLKFFDDSGNPLLLPLAFPLAPLAGPLLAAQLKRIIAPGAAVVVRTCGTGDVSSSSWARWQTDGNITASKAGSAGPDPPK
jgi:hypothetical protein